MKRRGFLGFLGGAAVAGPSMAKHAVTAAMSDTCLGSVSGASSLVGGLSGDVPVGNPFPPAQPDFALQLASLLGRTAAQHREFIARQHVHALDPDIAEYRAIRLQAKISMQRERDYWRGIASEKSWLQRAAEGLF